MCAYACTHSLKEGLSMNCPACENRVILMVGIPCPSKDRPGFCVVEKTQIKLQDDSSKRIGKCIYCGGEHEIRNSLQ